MAGLCHVSKQAKIESGKTPSDEELPIYEVSENNFRFDEINLSPKKHPINFECQYRFLTSDCGFLPYYYLFFNLVLFS